MVKLGLNFRLGSYYKMSRLEINPLGAQFVASQSSAISSGGTGSKRKRRVERRERTNEINDSRLTFLLPLNAMGLSSLVSLHVSPPPLNPKAARLQHAVGREYFAPK
jgi:hypothetical protein